MNAMLKILIPSQRSVRNWIGYIFPAWMIAVTMECLLVIIAGKTPTELDGIARMSLPRVVCVTGGFAVLFAFLSRFGRFQRVRRWILPGTFSLLSVLSLIKEPSILLAGLSMGILLILFVYALRGWNDAPLPSPTPQATPKRYFWLTLGLSIFVFLFMSIWTVCRHLGFRTYSYDFGIFSQMFHSMKTTGLPTTTLERDRVLSHFSVHVSPIYYVLLPFYWLIPSPLTLQVLQAAVVVSAVIPLWKLSGHHGLSGLQRFLVCGTLLLAPAFSGGVRDGLHENCFLTVLLLWLFYGIDAKKVSTLTIAAVLTLLVKEDAPVYVAVIGLWQLITGLLHRQRRSVIVGASLLSGAVIYFLGVTTYLAHLGDGVMTARYSNLMLPQDGSLLSVIKCVVLSPMKALYECATGEKLKFVAKTLLPLLGLPLLTRRYERYLLLIPYLLINLLTDYPYQFNIFYQYNFGTIAFLIYLTVVVLAEWKLERRGTIALIAAVVASAILFCAFPLRNGIVFSSMYFREAETNRQVEEILQTIPEDASVCAASRFTPHIASRTTLYDIKYCSTEHLFGCEYVIVDLRTSLTPKLPGHLLIKGYTEIQRIDGQLIVYQRNQQLR